MRSSIFNSKKVKILFNWGILIVFLVLLDQLLGSFLNNALYKTRSGASGGTLINALETNSDILLTGSSRAVLSLDPQIFESNLEGISCVNVARNGSGIRYSTAILHLISQKKSLPKYICLEVSPKSREDGTWIMPFKHFIENNDDLSNFILSMVEKPRRFQIAMLSNLYRFNDIIFGVFNPKRSENIGGYVPYIPNPSKPVNIKVQERSVPNISASLSLTTKNDLIGFIAASKKYDIKPILIIFPRISNVKYWNYKNDALVNYSEEQDVTILRYDIIEDYPWINDIAYYYDSDHLNINGAEKLSNIIAKDLKNILK